MSEMNKLDNISSMSDEELDAFIKSELNSSLMEDIKVDEELINKTIEAIDAAEGQNNVIGEDNTISFDNKKKGINIRKFIPIISMAACMCIIVMAGSIVYSRLGNTKSSKNEVNNVKENSQVGDSKKEDSQKEDFQINDSQIDNKEDGKEENNFMDGFSQEESAPDTGITPDSDFDSESDDLMSDVESIAPEVNDPTSDEEDSMENPSLPESDGTLDTENEDIVYDVAQILGIDELIETVSVYDEFGDEMWDVSVPGYLEELYEVCAMDYVEIYNEDYDESEVEGKEYVYIKTGSMEYYIIMETRDGIENPYKILVLEKH